ncbi:hypothetical protein Mal64_35810 [Pseudobythopirellula maris]|uniref:Uncharacterized protein n=1 Tax=Pseudobythopirellula maris TaxID=2527991 RepID=A0A5C5ZIW2_9BACT|nr:hypothetical protein [Pseudobythopirellula maris]TWT86751.1 hypothetical protein Mal64_35810 [Pseudobythopirellula maris]
MSIRWHLRFMVAAEMLGFLAAEGLVVYGFVAGAFGQSLAYAAVAMVVAGVVGVMAPRLLFRKLIPARCDQAGCSGRALVVSENPIVYSCKACGKSVETAVFEGGGPDHHSDRDRFG